MFTDIFFVLLMPPQNQFFTQALSEEERNKSQEEANKAKEELKQKTAIISGLNVSQWECFEGLIGESDSVLLRTVSTLIARALLAVT